MNAKPNDPEEIFWGKQFSWRTDRKVNSWLVLATVISALADIMFPHVVREWALGWRVAVVAVQFGAIALWARALVVWIRGMDELHRRITTSAVLFAMSATFFFMMFWHRLEKAGLFNAILPPQKPGASWDICTVGHGFLILVLFYGVGYAIFNRRYK